MPTAMFYLGLEFGFPTAAIPVEVLSADKLNDQATIRLPLGGDVEMNYRHGTREENGRLTMSNVSFDFLKIDA